MVITTAQLHSSKPELRFCAGSNPARGVSEIRDVEDLWQLSQLEISLGLSSVNHTTKTIHHHHHQNALIKILKKILSVIVLLTKLWSISYGALNFNEGKIEFTMEDLKEMIEQSISVRSGIQQCTV